MPQILLKDIISTDVLTLHKDDTAADLLDQMQKNEISCIVIVDEQNIPVGIFTEYDSVKIMDAKIDIYSTPVASVMSSSPFVVDENVSYFEAYEFIYAKNYRHLIAVDEEGKLSGIATEHDFLEYMGIEFFIQNRKVGELIHYDYPFVNVGTTLQELIALFKKTNTSSVIINENEIPQGIITERDIVKFAKQNISLETLVEEVMSSPVITANQHSSMQEVAITMHDKQVRTMVIVNDKHKYVGALNQHDITSSLHGKSVELLVNTINKKDNLIKSLLKQKEYLDIFHAAFEASANAIVITDRNGCIQWVNEAFTKLTGFNLSEARGKNSSQLIKSGVQGEQFYKKLWSTLTSGNVYKSEITNKHKDGHFYDENLTITPLVNGNGKITNFIAIKEDISEQKEAKRARLEINSVFETTHEGIMITDKNMNITRVNKAFTELTEYSEEDVLGCKPSLLKSGRHDESFYQDMWKSIKVSGYWSGEVWNRKKSGELYPELLSINEATNEFGEVTNYIGVFADITKQKHTEEKLEFLAHHDALTSLPNRLLLLSSLNQNIQQKNRDHQIFALLLLDLDRFKNINDSYGHIIGDELLQLVAKRLKQRLRGVDVICRLGGDEFAVLLQNIQKPEDAGRIANEIIDAVVEPWLLSNGMNIQIGVSVGISILQEEITSAEEMLQYADIALYKAKSFGGNNFVYYEDEMTEQTRKRMEIENSLRHAVKNDEFEVYLQPKIHIPTNKLIGAEALVRWIHPQKGLIPPDQFIGIAEEIGVIKDIGACVLKKTCALGKKWIDQGYRAINFSVNLSVHQLRMNTIVESITAVLQETKFNPKYLEIELTESALMENTEDVLSKLYALRAHDIKLVIDDFGTGYSSFGYLKKFPLDILKVDKTFVSDIPFDKDDMTITTAIVGMGHTLGFDIVAEGVETNEQLEFLKEIGCDTYQGYLASKPIPISEFETKYMMQQT